MSRPRSPAPRDHRLLTTDENLALAVDLVKRHFVELGLGLLTQTEADQTVRIAEWRQMADSLERDLPDIAAELRKRAARLDEGHRGS